MQKTVGIALLTTALWGCSDETPKPVQTQAQSAESRQQMMIERLKKEAPDKIRALLKDPESARFSELKYVEHSQGVCGLVNAKNGFGGYVGNRVFYVGAKGVAIKEADNLFADPHFNDVCPR